MLFVHFYEIPIEFLLYFRSHLMTVEQIRKILQETSIQNDCVDDQESDSD